MNKYIDAEKLIAEIRIIQQSLEHSDVRFNQVNKIRTECMIEFCKCILDVINSLQQEQSKKSQKNCDDCPHCVDRKGQYGWHFKWCFGGPYKGKFIAEIDECPLKQEQPVVDLNSKVTFDCIGKKVTMSVQELINYYIDRECCDAADECGF